MKFGVNGEHMNREALSASVIPEIATRRLTINLMMYDDGLVAVQSCETSGSKFLNRTSFRGLSTLEDVFVEELASALRACLNALPKGAHMLSVPEFLVELPGLALSGVRVLVSEPRDGVRSVIMRFKEFLGALNRILKPKVGIDERLSNNTEKLALSALMDICLPIMNFARSPELRAMDPEGQIQDMLEMKVQEFEFNAELLKRFVAVNQPQMETDALDRQTRHLLT